LLEPELSDDKAAKILVVEVFQESNQEHGEVEVKEAHSEEFLDHAVFIVALHLVVLFIIDYF